MIKRLLNTRSSQLSAADPASLGFNSYKAEIYYSLIRLKISNISDTLNFLFERTKGISLLACFKCMMKQKTQLPV